MVNNKHNLLESRQISKEKDGILQKTRNSKTLTWMFDSLDNEGPLLEYCLNIGGVLLYVSDDYLVVSQKTVQLLFVHGNFLAL